MLDVPDTLILSEDEALSPFPAVQGGLLVGYGRVSTRQQNLDRQIRALTKAGCGKIFTDKLSGKNTDRPELIECLKFLREGDILIVPSLDRLARSMQDLITMTGDLRKRGIGFKSLHENLDTTTPGGRLVFHVFAALAEFIRELIIENTREGIAAAKARGQQLGRPRAMTDEQVSHAVGMLSQPKASAKSIAKMLGVSRSTLYAYVPELAAIRANAKAKPVEAVPVQRAPITRDQEAWWQQADFHLCYEPIGGTWRLTHAHYPAGDDEPIPVDGYPAASDRLRRNQITAQQAAATAIEDLIGIQVVGWEENDDGTGEPYWYAQLRQTDLDHP